MWFLWDRMINAGFSRCRVVEGSCWRYYFKLSRGGGMINTRGREVVVEFEDEEEEYEDPYRE